MKPIILSVLLSLLSSSCCFQYGDKPSIKYTGTLNDKSRLPFLDILADDFDLTTAVATSSLTWGCSQKINAGQVMPLITHQDLVYFEYRSISQDDKGNTVWEFIWDHKKYGANQKRIEYTGEPVYAIKRKDFYLGLIPQQDQ